MAKAATKSTLRKSSIQQWPKKGQSADHGLGSRSTRALVELEFKNKTEVAYKKIVTIVKGLTDTECRAACCAACSDFTWSALVERSAVGRTVGPRLGSRDIARIDFIRQSEGDESADMFKRLLLGAKAATAKNGRK